MQRTISLLRNKAGFTLAETMIAFGVTAAISGALMVGVVTTTKSFNAALDYSISAGDQMRIADFINRDLRAATAVTALGSSYTFPSVTLDGVVKANVTVVNPLQVTLPAYYSGNGTTGYTVTTPTINTTTKTVTYTGTAETVYYAKYGSAFYRIANNVGTAIATNVSDFAVSTTDLTNSVTCAITFKPLFQYSPDAASTNNTRIYTKVYLRNKSARS